MWIRPSAASYSVAVAGMVSVICLAGGPVALRAAEPAPSAAAPAPTAEPSRAADLPPGDGAGPGAEQARRLHDEAKELYLSGRYGEALRRLERALEFDPDGKDLHYNTAFVAEKLGRLEIAIEHYRICAKLEPRPWERRRLEAVVERVQGAKRRQAKARAAASRPRPTVPSASPPREPVDFGSWPYIGTAVAGSALVFGTVLAVHAASVAPEKGTEATSAGVPIDDTRDAADAANASAVAANVAFLTAAAAGVATVVLLLIERVDRSSSAARTDWRDGVVPGRLGGLGWQF